MARVARALINFIDSSHLYVELSKKMEAGDSLLMCHKIIGMPENAPKDKPSIALSIDRTAKAGQAIEVAIPIARINGISIQQEFLGKDVPNDMHEIWD